MRLGPREDRVVLAVLVAWAGQVVSTDRLTDAVWGDRPPRSSLKLLQKVVMRLRKALGADVIHTTRGGYVLRVPPDTIDLRRFEQMVSEGRACAANGDWRTAATAWSGALELWNGPPLGELGEWSPAVAERARLEELHRCVSEELAEAELTCGRHRGVGGRPRDDGRRRAGSTSAGGRCWRWPCIAVAARPKHYAPSSVHGLR